MNEWVWIVLILSLPLQVYLCVKLAVYAFFQARWQFRQDHREGRPDNEGGADV